MANSGRGKFILSSLLALLICTGVVYSGMALLNYNPQNRGVLAPVVLGGIFLALTFHRTGKVLLGKPVYREFVSLPLPGHAEHEFSVPMDIRKARLLVFFAGTTHRYCGNVTLTNGHKMSVDRLLPNLQPKLIKIPKWMPTSDAGQSLEMWNRNTGMELSPVILDLPFPVAKNDRLRLTFELESNFKGTSKENRFPIADSENVEICLKHRIL
jgi:hypothetical protein